MSGETTTQSSVWNWQTPEPIAFSPYFDWPVHPFVILRYLLGRGFLLSLNTVYVLLAIVMWWFLAPDLESWARFSFDWVAELYVINLVLIGGPAALLHLYFHTFRRQGVTRKFDATEPRVPDAKFLGGRQVWDNMFYTLVSGVSLWTAFQAIVMWAYTTGLAPWLDWREHPIWFAALFVLLPIWGSVHFYVIHRLLHWRPLYKIAHAVHHRNVNPIPWSGLSMHPIEHVLYLSFVFIHLLIASHPIHMFYLSYTKLISAVTSHSGYEDLLVGERRTVEIGEFFHQIHHRYFDCNYGTLIVPLDKWFGSLHDGSAEATVRVRALQLERHREASH